MSQEAWLVITVGAGFLLLGIAASPLGWAAILSRRTRFERESEASLREFRDRVDGLVERLERCESAIRERERTPAGEATDGEFLPLSRSVKTAALAGRRPGGRVMTSPAGGPGQPNLITVPRLAGSLDRQPAGADATNGLSQRYAAIWQMADAGSSPDAIARATGQPIGQIELILGLRRQGVLRSQ